MLVTTYDRDKLHTVCEFFGPNSSKAYELIREEGIESQGSYREASKTKGRGARLYDVEDLQRIQEILNKRSNSVQVGLPDGCLDFVLISEQYELPRHVLSSIFAAVGLEPCGKFRKAAKSKLSNAYDAERVVIVMNGLTEIRKALKQ